MKKIYLITTAALVVLALASLAATPAPNLRNFVAPLSGGQEVPARDTHATGNAVFQVRADGSELEYKLIVANIENVFASHIHCGAAGVNGPVGVTLFMGSPASGPVNGIIARGTITAPNPGNACGWVTLDDVLAAMHSGDTYVNVHTNDGMGDANTGPGDFPGGEIRGQVH